MMPRIAMKKKNVRRLLSMVVTVAVVISFMPIMGTTVNAGTEPDYLTFTAQKANSSVLLEYYCADKMQYSLDGEKWENYKSRKKIVLKSIGDKVMFRGENFSAGYYDEYEENWSSYEGGFSMTGRISASGSVTSLTDMNGNNPNVKLTGACYSGLFWNCKSLITSPELPTVKLAEFCYEDMFGFCSNLLDTPELPATELADYCYSEMFYECKKLKKAPALYSTEMYEGCYQNMFYNCSELTSAPELPAKELNEYCYRSMFGGCSSLTNVPKLSATELAEGCYDSMFCDCTSLTSVPRLYAIKMKPYCYEYMFCGCKKIKMYNSFASNHSRKWLIPAKAETAESWNEGMFEDTKGDFKGDPVPGKIYYQAGSRELLDYVDDTTSTEYSPELAYQLMLLADKAYSVGKDGKCSDVSSYLNSIGIKNVDTFNYYEDIHDPRYLLNSVAYAIGYNDEEGKRTVTVAIRGSYGDVFELSPDWISDLSISTDINGRHTGFEQAASPLFSKLKELGLLSSNNRYIITGHSRGAGVGNLLAVKLSDYGVPKENVYDYNFACPDTARKIGFDWNPNGVHDNIFNVGYCGDPVTLVPGMFGNVTGARDIISPILSNWGKFGNSIWYCNDWTKISDTAWDANKHMQESYLTFLKKMPDISEYKTWAEMKVNNIGNIADSMVALFACPVDVTVIDDNGNTLASVKDDKVKCICENNTCVMAYTIGDKKMFIIPSGLDVQFRLTGTENGSMDCELLNVNNKVGRATSEKEYCNVELQENKTMDIDFADDTLTASSSGLYVTDSSGDRIREISEDGKETAHTHTWDHVVNPSAYMKNGCSYDKCESCGQVNNYEVITGYSKSYVSSFKINKGKKCFTAKWKKQSKTNQKKFSGYRLKYSINSDMSEAKTIYVSKGSSSKKISKLSSKKKYYVEICTYVKKSGSTFYSKGTKKAVTTK